MAQKPLPQDTPKEEEMANELALVLSRVWDEKFQGGGERTLQKGNRILFKHHVFIYVFH